MCLFLMITEVLTLNGSSGSLGYVILPVKMQFIVCLVLFGHEFPKKASKMVELVSSLQRNGLKR